MDIVEGSKRIGMLGFKADKRCWNRQMCQQVLAYQVFIRLRIVNIDPAFITQGDGDAIPGQ